MNFPESHIHQLTEILVREGAGGGGGGGGEGGDRITYAPFLVFLRALCVPDEVLWVTIRATLARVTVRAWPLWSGAGSSEPS